MSSIAASLQPVPRRQYVSTGIFTANFFTYGKAAVVNGVQRYALTQVSEDDNDCPKGHILRENGRKLIKDVNIDLNDPNTTANEYTYLVGVIDTTADPAVAGFIDPNCPVFTTFNTDKPYFLDSPVEAEDAATGLQDIGAPVFTRGDITTTAGDITATAGNITATAGNLVIGTGRLTVGAKVAGRATLALGTIAITVTGVTTASLAFVSLVSSVPGAGSLTVSHRAVCTTDTITITALVAAGTINNADVSVVNWFVVN